MSSLRVTCSCSATTRSTRSPNSRRELAVALHVYGGDFFTVERSEWDPETYEERPRDLEATGRLFEEANERWFAEGT